MGRGMDHCEGRSIDRNGGKLMHLATYETRHFTFEGSGDSEQAAFEALERGLRVHGAQCGLPDQWWLETYSGGDWKADCCQLRTLSHGAAYRDREPID